MTKLPSDLQIEGNASKSHLNKMLNVQETQKTVPKQTENSVFATFLFVIYFTFEFKYKPLALYIDW